MHHSAEPDFLSQLDTSFAQLNPQEVEQFYAAYKQWLLQQHIASLHQRILHIQQQLAENTQLIQQTQPSPIALATLVRLQSNGVNDIDLLDTMFARGEAWLDATMQRLDYCEQINDFISDDYTQWCKRALEGAFDWIDSLRDDASTSPSTIEESPPLSAGTAANAEAEATEALLLQKLASESDELEDFSWQEATLKQTAIKLPAREAPEASNPAEIAAEQSAHEEYIPLQDIGGELPLTGKRSDATSVGARFIAPQGPGWEIIPEFATNILQEENQSNENPADADLEQADAINRVPTTEEYIAPEEPLPLEDTSTSEGESPAFVEHGPPDELPGDEEPVSTASPQPPLIEFAPQDEPPTNADPAGAESAQYSTTVPKKRGLIRRITGMLLGE